MERLLNELAVEDLVVREEHFIAASAREPVEDPVGRPFPALAE
jgi:hypothetical protein